MGCKPATFFAVASASVVHSSFMEGLERFRNLKNFFLPVQLLSAKRLSAKWPHH